MNRTSKRLLAVGLPLAGIAATGIAFAAWTSTGSGTGTAKSTTSANSVIAPDVSVADLYPGATSSVTVTISNPNAYAIMVTSIPAGTSDLADKGTVGDTSDDCAAGAVTSDSRTDATGLVTTTAGVKVIPAHLSGTYSLVTHMIASPSDNCKSTTFSLPLTNAQVVSAA
jgi:hypothetical protein